MGSVVIVAIEPGLEGAGPPSGVSIATGISPALHEGGDEPLRLAVGPGRVGPPGVDVADTSRPVLPKTRRHHRARDDRQWAR